MKALLAKTLIRLLGFLPLGLARALGCLVGELNYLFNAKGTQIARTNIQHCFPDWPAEQQNQLLRNSMREWGKTALEMPVIWQCSETWLKKRIVNTVNQQVLDDALASGKGLILLGPHLGNWEIVGLIISSCAEMTILYQPPRQPELEAIIKKARSRSGAKLVPTDRRGVIALIKALQKGEISGILPDQEPELSGGVFAPFFGVQALTMTLLQNLLKKTGAIAVVTAVKRVPGGFEVVYMKPDEDIYSEDTVKAATAMNRSVENIVRLFPEQYQWEYKRFKKRPEGEDKIYVKEKKGK